MSTQRTRRRPTPARPKEAPRPRRATASIEVLPARFVTLSPRDTEAAIEALALLLAPVVGSTKRVGEPDATMEHA
jgi:hypothetical protein